MSFLQVMQRISSGLDGAGIPYMLTGSFASVFYGAPRSTQDIDIVIAPTPANLRTFLLSLPEAEYYVDVDAALAAHKRESLFNVIDLKTGWKIDMFICKSRPFSREEFGRRRASKFENLSLFVASSEDVILSKLEWAKLGQSQRQIQDVAGILKIRSESLDLAYLEKWVRELALTKEWMAAQNPAEISGPG